MIAYSFLQRKPLSWNRNRVQLPCRMAICKSGHAPQWSLTSILTMNYRQTHELYFWQFHAWKWHYHNVKQVYEPMHGKTNNLHRRKQRHRSALQHLCFPYTVTTQIVQFLYFLNPKFPAFNHLLWLHNTVCVGSGRNPNCWFSQTQAHIILITRVKLTILIVSVFL